jgi:hypothetical protein
MAFTATDFAAARLTATYCSAASKAATVRRESAAAAVSAPAAINEPVLAPSVPVAPAGPWTHAKKNTAVKVSRAVKAIRRAGIWRIVVIAVLTNRLYANSNHDLGLSAWHHGQAREQCSSTE